LTKSILLEALGKIKNTQVVKLLKVMHFLEFTNALLVSNPMRMERVMKLAKYYEVNSRPSLK